MILQFLILINCLQILLLLISDELSIKHGRKWVFWILLLCNFFLFPLFFIPQIISDKVNCGIPIMAITLAFWVFGTGLITMTYTFYDILKKTLF